MWTFSRMAEVARAEERAISGGCEITKLTQQGVWDSPAIKPYTDRLREICAYADLSFEELITIAKEGDGAAVAAVSNGMG